MAEATHPPYPVGRGRLSELGREHARVDVSELRPEGAAGACPLSWLWPADAVGHIRAAHGVGDPALAGRQGREDGTRRRIGARARAPNDHGDRDGPARAGIRDTHGPSGSRFHASPRAHTGAQAVTQAVSTRTRAAREKAAPRHQRGKGRPRSPARHRLRQHHCAHGLRALPAGRLGRSRAAKQRPVLGLLVPPVRPQLQERPSNCLRMAANRRGGDAGRRPGRNAESPLVRLGRGTLGGA